MEPSHPTFLVLTDLSDAAERAARYAAALAAPLGAQLVLLHLFHDPLLAPEMVTITAELAYRNQAETAAALRQLADDLPVPAEPEVTVMGLYEAVLDANRRYQPLLVVVGVSTEHDWLERLLNNQAVPVLRRLGLPLLLVPEAVAVTQLPGHVVIAADTEPFRLTPASYAARRVLLNSWAAAYTVVYVREEWETSASPVVRVLNHVWDSGLLFPQQPCDTYTVQAASPAAGILQAATDTQADLLILPLRPRSVLAGLWHRSVVAGLLHHCRFPVLLLPTEA
ncbi:universal stress protein [Hymenobacter rigui]|nr:universal stress protein [Hymenobacter rigui]